MTLRELHAILWKAFDEIDRVRSGMPDGMSTDTAHAVGLAQGTVAKAKALVGRDIDDAKATGEAG